MESWLLFFSAVIISSCMIQVSQSNPQIYRGCGESLHNLMAMVCKGRGYNSFFSQNDNPPSPRNRRGIGIVDECCRSSCSLSTVLQYCGPLTTESPVNTQIRKRSDSATDWALETNSEGTEMLTFRPRSSLDELKNEESRKHHYGTERRHIVHAGISNSIQKQSASDVERTASHESNDNAGISNSIKRQSAPDVAERKSSHVNGLRQLMNRFKEGNKESRSKEERRSSKEERRSSKERGSIRCNSVTGCRGSGKSKDISGIERRDFDVRRPPSSIDKLKSSEQSSSEQNRIRHRNHKNYSSRERKTSNEDKPKQSQVGTVAPFFQKGVAQPIFFRKPLR